MDLNKESLLCPHEAELRKNGNFGDTLLCLNGIAFGETNTTSYRCSETESNIRIKFSIVFYDSCRLVLRLGPNLRVYADEYNNMRLSKKK